MADAGNGAVKKASGGRCPKCGAMIEYLCYWEKAVNIGEYWPDGYHDIRHNDVIEFYFLCPECGKILFDREEAARKFLEDKRGRDIPLGLAPA
jgi:predicted RNA-binding Zn-ribbon protein involved in translation (DUF1610 family)